MSKAKHIYTVDFTNGKAEVLADDLSRVNELSDEWLVLSNDGDEVFRMRIRYVVGWSRQVEKRDFA